MATKTATVDSAGTVAGGEVVNKIIGPKSIRVLAWEATLLPVTAAELVGVRAGETGDVVPLVKQGQGYDLDADEQRAGLYLVALDPANPPTGDIVFTLATSPR